MSIKIIKLEDNDSEQARHCDEYIQSSALAGYGTTPWQNILQTIYKRKTLRLCAQDNDGDIIGHFLGYYDDTSATLYSMRFGLAAETPEAFDLLCATIDNFCQERRISATLLTSGATKHNFKGRAWEKSNLLIPLAEQTMDDLWNNVPKKTRNMIRKAEKTGLLIECIASDSHAFYPLYQRHMLAKNLRLKSIAYFQKLERELKDDLSYFRVLKNGKICGYMVFSISGDIVSYLYNVCEHEVAQDGANNLLIWHAMQHYSALGKSCIELGESTEGSPVFDFKKRLHKDIKITPIHYADILHTENKRPIPLKLRLAGKIQAFESILLPFTPETLKIHLLRRQDRRGRVL